MDTFLMLIVWIVVIFVAVPVLIWLIGHFLAFANGFFRPTISGQGTVVRVDHYEAQEIPSYSDSPPSQVRERWVAIVEVDGHRGFIEFLCDPRLVHGQTLPVEYRIGWNGEATWFAHR